jgi:2-succinyl-5-enolpyruvyl-6-hydroxy-3-cyclohexene-1-carboxylate synthase
VRPAPRRPLPRLALDAAGAGALAAAGDRDDGDRRRALAAFFALGAAQASGAPVAILCTSGTAAANFHPAVCEADQSAVPLLVLTADRPPELRGIGAGQTIDQLKLYGARCAGSARSAPTRPTTTACSTTARRLPGLRAARGEPRPGPVHLNFPGASRWRRCRSSGAVTASDPLAWRAEASAR